MLASSIKQFQARIWGSNNEILGCGWLAPGDVIITCAHVVEKHRENIHVDFPLIGNDRYTVAEEAFFPVNENAVIGDIEDIAVLRLVSSVRPPADARPAAVSDEEMELYDRQVSIFGFPKGMDRGDYIDSALKGPIGNGWIQFDHNLTSKQIAKGFSGTAVWDKDGKKVVGMVVGRQARDDKISGYMIPIATLIRAWPEIDIQKTGADIAKPVLGPLVSKMCNRNLQEAKFGSFFRETCTDAPKQPQIYVIHGKEGECHESLVERFRATRLRKLIHKESNGTVVQYNVPLGFDNDFTHRRNLFLLRMTEAIGGDDEAYPLTFREMCNLPGIRDRKHPIVVLTHQIEASKWDRHYKRLVEWYVNEFWAVSDPCGDMPLFLVFLMIIYPADKTLGFFDKIVHKTARKRKEINKTLSNVLQPEKKQCHGIVLPELDEVEPAHVRQWFFEYSIPISEKDKIDRIKAIFDGRKTRCMADVEAALERTVNNHTLI